MNSTRRQCLPIYFLLITSDPMWMLIFYWCSQLCHSDKYFLNFLNPGKKCENIRSRISSDFPEEFCNSEFDNKENVPTTKMGCGRKLRPLEEFLIVLCHLRRGFSEWHWANLYGVLSGALISCTWSLDKSAFGHLHVKLFYNTNHASWLPMSNPSEDGRLARQPA